MSASSFAFVSMKRSVRVKGSLTDTGSNGFVVLVFNRGGGSRDFASSHPIKPSPDGRAAFFPLRSSSSMARSTSGSIAPAVRIRCSRFSATPQPPPAGLFMRDAASMPAVRVRAPFETASTSAFRARACSGVIGPSISSGRSGRRLGRWPEVVVVEASQRGTIPAPRTRRFDAIPSGNADVAQW